MKARIPLLVLLALLASSHPGARQLPGALSFTDVTSEAGMYDPAPGSHGACWADATGDGFPDLLVTYNFSSGSPRRQVLPQQWQWHLHRGCSRPWRHCQ